jgi:hypothetical protein
MGSKALFLAVVLLCAPAFAQNNLVPVPPIFVGPGTTPRLGSNLTITFCTSTATGAPCSPLAQAFSDSTNSFPINQVTTPLKTDALGNAPVFYAAPGQYSYTVSGPAISAPQGPFQITVPCIPGSTCVAANGNNTFTGNNTHSGAETFTNGVTTNALNGHFWAGPGATPTIDTQVAACVAAGAGIVEIHPLYTGAESTNLTSNAVDGSNYVIYRGTNACPVMDWRQNANPGKGYGINVSGNTLQSQNKLGITQAITSPTVTTSAILGTNQVTGTIPANQAMAAVTAEVDGEGSLTPGANSFWQAINGQWAMRATNAPTIGSIEGVGAGGGLDRTAANAAISFAWGFHAYPMTNASTSGGTIANAYGVFSDLQTVGTSRNYSFYGKGNTAFVEGMGIDIDNPGTSGPFTLLRFGQTNNIGTAGVNVFPAGLFTSPVVKFCNQNAAKFNWMLGSQINVDQSFEIDPDNAVGVCGSGNTYGSALFALTNVAGAATMTVTALQNPQDGIASVPGSDTNEAFIGWNHAKTIQGFAVTGLGQITLHETTPPTGTANADQVWGDNADHMVHENLNNGGDQHLPFVIMLTSQYSNSTTGFTNVTGGNNMAFTVAASRNYTATCHLYYQAAATGGLNIEFTGPASPTTVAYGLNEPLSATTWNNQVAGPTNAFGTSIGAVVTTATTNFDAIVSFSLQNGANAGTVQLLAKSSAAVSLLIQSGSYCMVQ